MGAGEDILKRLDALEQKIDRLMAHLGANGAAAGAQSGGNVAPLSDIQGERGDVEIKKDPKRWTGRPLAPIRASQCPPDYLEIVADFLDFKADKPRPGKEQYAAYDRRDAARCRRWAVEIREGRVQQASVRERDDSPPPPVGDEDHGASGGYSDDVVLADGYDGPPTGDDDSPF